MDLCKNPQLVNQAYENKDGRHLREEFWYKTGFLPRKIMNRMDASEDCFAYMFRHTQRRPRDLITQMQYIINEARMCREFPKISNKSVIAGVHNDKSLIQILSDALIPYEYKVLPDGLIKGARSVFYQRPRFMRGYDLRRFSQELYGVYHVNHIDSDLFLESLLNCGVIGLVRDQEIVSEEPKLYCMADFEYLMQGNLPVGDRFLYCVHPAMGDVFQMERSDRNHGAVYPMPHDDLWMEEAAEIS